MTTYSSASVIFQDAPASASSDWLSQELSSAENRLQETQRLIQRINDVGDGDDTTSMSQTDADDVEMVVPPARQLLQQLSQMEQTVEALALARDVVEWNNTHNNATTAATPVSTGEALFQDASTCDRLGQLLCRHADCRTSRLYTTLVDQEYRPLHAYVRTQLLLQLRKLIARSGYPSPEGCARLCALPSSSNAMTPLQSTMARCCEALTKLQMIHHRVLHHLRYGTQQPPPASPFASGDSCDVLVELIRPLVERIRFHFVDNNHGGEQRVTASRMDRLPEWLRTYVQEHILEGPTGETNNNSDGSGCSCPWQVVSRGLAPYVPEDMPAMFLNELVGILQWVLGVARNFFRHESIVGPNSNPMLLCQAIEQLLLLDDTLRNLLPMGQADRLVRLMDIFVAGDDELLSWWLARERELAFSTLFASQSEQEAPLSQQAAAWIQTGVAPRAELFCALIRSVQAKASVFSFSGPYLNAVAVPLCMKFLEDVHDTSTALSQELCRSGGVTIAGTVKKEALRGPELTANLERWIQLINGTHLAAAILTREHPGVQQNIMAPSSSSSVNDLARFGRSLEQLQNVLVEEFAATFVETFLLERTKLASYLMRCSHFLSHPFDSDDEEEDDGDLSHDLRETQNALMALLRLYDEDRSDDQNFAVGFARVMRSKVIPLVADKFLEVALDIHDLTPDILPEGAAIFVRDIMALFVAPQQHGDDLPGQVLRLLEIGRMMTMESKSLQALQAVLLGLVGGPEDPTRPWALFSHQFTADGTIFEEALSMLRAKGFASMQVEDAVSILNRRRDLMGDPEMIDLT